MRRISAALNDEELLHAFHTCLESSDDGFLFVDTTGNIAYINQAYCDYIGITKEEAIGSPVLEYITTSNMARIALNPDYKPELNVLHQVSNEQYLDKEPYVIVNRANASIDGRPIAGVAQIKFVRRTLKLSEILNEVYNELDYYKEEVGRLAMDRYSFSNIVGNSAKLQEAKNIALRAAGSDFSVLLTGETGTGKEVFANAIHYASNRKTKPFIRINCASIPSELLESELFGYAEGAFTGAKRGGKKGKFELADGGTLFLDEIGDMPLIMQAKILRALQEGEIERIGGEKPISVNIRIIAATNKNLFHEVQEKRFRQDLYYRLNVIDLHIPALRKRKDDISPLINAFLSEINTKYHTEVQILDEVRDIFLRYSWPGNVRELKNTIERCYALNENGKISLYTVPKNILGHIRMQDYGIHKHNNLDTVLGEIEKTILLEEIGRNSGNLRKTAKNLGIHRTTLYRKLEKYGLSRNDLQQDIE